MLAGSAPNSAPDTMATAIVSPSARPSPRTTAPTMPLDTHGRVTRRTDSQSDMPSAVAPSRGSIGTCRIRSRVVLAMIGMIITASTRPDTNMPSPLPVLPRK